jgi:hypothetical protein
MTTGAKRWKMLSEFGGIKACIAEAQAADGVVNGRPGSRRVVRVILLSRNYRLNLI